MKQIIHLYVKSEKHYREVYPTHAQATWYSSSDKKHYIGRILDSRQKHVVNIIGKYAEEHGIELKVHDLAHKTERKEARKRGIRKTPTTLIGEIKIIGVPAIEEIEAAMAVLNESKCEK